VQLERTKQASHQIDTDIMHVRINKILLTIKKYNIQIF